MNLNTREQDAKKQLTEALNDDIGKWHIEYNIADSYQDHDEIIEQFGKVCIDADKQGLNSALVFGQPGQYTLVMYNPFEMGINCDSSNAYSRLETFIVIAKHLTTLPNWK